MSNSQPAQFDDSDWPLLVVRMPPIIDMVAMESIVAGFDDVHRRNERYAIVVDCSAIAKFPGAAERKVLGEWLSRTERDPKVSRLMVGSGIVLTSGPLRALVSAINWVHPPAAPQKWTATEAEAIDWCCARLVEAEVVRAAAIEALRARAVPRVAAVRRSR